MPNFRDLPDINRSQNGDFLVRENAAYYRFNWQNIIAQLREELNAASPELLLVITDLANRIQILENLVIETPPAPVNFSFADFVDVTAFQLNGSAIKDGAVLSLTQGQSDQSGSAFITQPFDINANMNFSTHFSARITPDPDGADGMAFVIHADTMGAAALGAAGGGLGYIGIDRSVAIDFDTYQGFGEVSGNEISVVLDGDEESVVMTEDFTDFLFTDGNTFFVWIDYTANTDTLKVFVSSGSSKPLDPVLIAFVNLAGVVGIKGYVGFTAGTGGLSNTHSVLNWQFNTAF